jgi:hypothetical protein
LITPLKASIRRAKVAIVCSLIALLPLTAHASPVVDLGHYYVAQNSSLIITPGVSDAGNAAAEDIEGMTFTVQIAAGVNSSPSITSVDFLNSTIWTGHVSAFNVSEAAGGGAQFQSFTLITDNAGDFVNANGSVATVALSASAAAPGDYALKLIGTIDPGSDSQFTDSVGDAVPATFGNGVLSVVAPGDFNRDGHVDAADITAMLAALANLPSYESSRGLTDAGLLAIGDLNADHKVTNADLQSLLNRLQVGAGNSNPVPEPATAYLLLGALAVGFQFRRLQKST